MARVPPPRGVAAIVFVLACNGPQNTVSSKAHGSGTIAGSFDGRPFDAIAAAYRIGSPDDPVRTVVVELFDAVVECADVTAPGWDTQLDAVQVLEIKLVGTTPDDYPVTGAPSPGQGEADAAYTLTATSGTPSETSASDGSVSLDGIADQGAAQGSFDLTFPQGDTLAGSFDAAWCADGHEP